MRGTGRIGVMTEVLVLTLLAAVLHELVSFRLTPDAGPVTLLSVPVFAAAFRRGVKPGMACGFLAGLLLLLAGSTEQETGLLRFADPVAFAALGLAGLVPLREEQSARKRMILGGTGLLIGGAGRFLVYLGALRLLNPWIPAGPPGGGGWTAWLVSSVLPETVLAAAVLLPALVRVPRLASRQVRPG